MSGNFWGAVGSGQEPATSTYLNQPLRDIKDIPITKERLTQLLEAKVRAQEAYTKAFRHAAALTSTDDKMERVERDIVAKQAQMASINADQAYDDALRSYCDKGGK